MTATATGQGQMRYVVADAEPYPAMAVRWEALISDQLSSFLTWSLQSETAGVPMTVLADRSYTPQVGWIYSTRVSYSSQTKLEQDFARKAPATARLTHLLAVDDPDTDLRLLAFADEYDPDAEDSFWQALAAFEQDQGIEASAFYGVWNDQVLGSLAGDYRILI